MKAHLMFIFRLQMTAPVGVLFALLTCAGETWAEPARSDLIRQPTSFERTLLNIESGQLEWTPRIQTQMLLELRRRLSIAARRHKSTEDEAFLDFRESLSARLVDSDDQKMLSVEQWQAFLNRLRGIEQATISSLSRKYRVRVYETFRSRRAEFDQRYKAWEKVERAWKKRGANTSEHPRLIGWLKSAITASHPLAIRSLPAWPNPKNEHGIGSIVDNENHSPADPTLSPLTVAPKSENTDRVKIMPQPPKRTASSQSLSEADIGRPITESPKNQSAQDRELLASRAGQPDRSQRVAQAAPQGDISDGSGHDAQITINITELSDRATGYNLALASLEERLSEVNNPQVAQVRRNIGQLERLATVHLDLSPYYRIVSSEKARRLDNLKPYKPLVALAAKRVFELRKRLKNEQSLRSDPESDSQLAELDQLSARLAQIVLQRRP